MVTLQWKPPSVRLGPPQRPLRRAGLEPAALQYKDESYNFVIQKIEEQVSLYFYDTPKSLRR